MWDRLKSMTGGDSDRMQMYVDMYKEAINENIPLLSSAIETADIKAIRLIMHSMKPLYRIAGLDELWEGSNTIEVLIDTHGADEKIITLAKDVMIKMHNSLKLIDSFS